VKWVARGKGGEGATTTSVGVDGGRREFGRESSGEW